MKYHDIYKKQIVYKFKTQQIELTHPYQTYNKTNKKKWLDEHGCDNFLRRKRTGSLVKNQNYWSENV